jgi:hypothetical protein
MAWPVAPWGVYPKESQSWESRGGGAREGLCVELPSGSEAACKPSIGKQSEEFGTSHSFPLMHWRFDSPGNWLEAKPADEAFTGTQVLWALSA